MQHLQEDVKRNKFSAKHNPILEKSLIKSKSRPQELPIESKGTRSGVCGLTEAQVPHNSHLLDYSIKLSLRSIQKDFEDQVKMMALYFDEQLMCLNRSVLRDVNCVMLSLSVLALSSFTQFPLAVSLIL